MDERQSETKWQVLERWLVDANGDKPLPPENEERWIGAFANPFLRNGRPTFSIRLPTDENTGGWYDHEHGYKGTIVGLFAAYYLDTGQILPSSPPGWPNWTRNPDRREELGEPMLPLAVPPVIPRRGKRKGALRLTGQAGAGDALCSVQALLCEPEEDTPYVLDALLPAAGTSMLIGKPKVGKSTLARTIALGVARGEAVLGRETQHTSVCYLAMEEKRSEVAAWFRAAGVADEEIWLHLGAPDEGDPLDFLLRCIDRSRAGFVVVDPMHMLLGVMDINDYSRVNQTIMPVVELARETGVHIMLLHHQGKGDRSGGDRVLGSTALFGAVDALLTVTREGGAFAVESVQRYGRDLDPVRLERDPATGMVRVLGPVDGAGETDWARRDRYLQDRVLPILAAGERTEEALLAQIGGNRAAVGRALRGLLGADHPARSVERTGTGRRGDPFVYSLVTPPTTNGDGTTAP